MSLARVSRKLLNLATVLHDWLELLTGLEASRRGRIATYADEIAATLARAAEALSDLEASPADKHAARRAFRELGRISGYVEDIVALLQHRLDGRKLAGVKRRLDGLSGHDLSGELQHEVSGRRIDRVVEAEGYFRALADGLRL